LHTIVFAACDSDNGPGISSDRKPPPSSAHAKALDIDESSSNATSHFIPSNGRLPEGCATLHHERAPRMTS
jgi:hypothetical protein